MSTTTITNYVNSETGLEIQTLVAYTIRETPNEVDDAILDDSAAITEVINTAVVNMAGKNPTKVEALAAGMNLLGKIIVLSGNKWALRIFNLLKKFI